MTPAEKQRLEEARRAWEAQTLKPALDKTPDRPGLFAASDGVPLERVYTPEHTATLDYVRDAGFPGEELKHHQGGAIGYRAREWVAHPRSTEVVHERQAFAWNPTITGTKIEDTALLLDGRLEIITTSPDWPSIPLAHGLTASDVWPLS